MRLVSIETTSDHLGICFAEEMKSSLRFSTLFKRRPLQQSDLLIPELDRMLKKKKWKGPDVDVWAVDVGPGSFTGVRVGVATARALAQAFGKPLVGINALEAMASQVAQNLGRRHVIVAERPALSGEVYGAVYATSDHAVLEKLVLPGWFTEEEFRKKVEQAREARPAAAFRIVGDAPHPEAIARLALARFQNQRGAGRFDYNKVVPLYLQPSWAEREKSRDAARS